MLKIERLETLLQPVLLTETPYAVRYFGIWKTYATLRLSHAGKGAEQELVKMETFPATVLVRLSQRASVVINQELLKELQEKN